MRYATGRRRRLTTGVLADEGVVLGVAPPGAGVFGAPAGAGVAVFAAGAAAVFDGAGVGAVDAAFRSTTAVPKTYSFNFSGKFFTQYFSPIFIESKKAFVHSGLTLATID